MKFTWFNFVNVLLVLAILNLIDAISTLYLFSAGLALEANPIMNVLLHMSGELFIFIKLFVAWGSLICLWVLREHKFTRIAIIPVFLLYVYVFIKHLHIIYTIFIES